MDTDGSDYHSKPPDLSSVCESISALLKSGADMLFALI